MTDQYNIEPLREITDDGLINLETITISPRWVDNLYKIQSSTCPHCKFLYDTFLKSPDATDRDYYLMTLVFVYLHGGDVCEYSKKVTGDK